MDALEPHPGPADVEAAARRIAPLTGRTPLRPSTALSELLGRRAHLKLETEQASGSFKLRGAANRLLQLDAAARRRGVVTQSSGNHGRAMAWVARRLGIGATVFLSERVPAGKVEAIEALGAEVRVEGADQDASWEKAVEHARSTGATFVHPFDDPEVITGQGTLGVEILEQCPDLETLLVPLSGGGLAAGVAMAAKSIRPALRVLGVSQAEGAAMAESLRAGRIVPVRETPTLADALAGGLPPDNRHTFSMCRRWLDGALLVPEEAIAEAMLFAFDREDLLLEGGAAVGIAALLQDPAADWGDPLAAICTGSNVDRARLSRLRGDAGRT